MYIDFFHSREGTACALCAAYMVKHKNMRLQQALGTIRTKRPEIQPSPSYCLQLQEYEEQLDSVKRFKNSRFGYIRDKVLGYLDIGYFQNLGAEKDIVEKLTHNWIQLTIYLLFMLFMVRLFLQFISFSLSNDDEEDEVNRLPCV